MKIRKTARLVLLDRANRIFLIKIEDPDIAQVPNAPPKRRPFWITPGGKVEDGESYREALVRELKEETGIPEEEAEFGVCIWVGEHDLIWAGVMTHLYERFFLTRVNTSAVDLGGMTDEERTGYRDHRWWTLEEMQASDEVFLPKDFRTLFVPIIAGKFSEEPLRIDMSNPPELSEEPS